MSRNLIVRRRRYRAPRYLIICVGLRAFIGWIGPFHEGGIGALCDDGICALIGGRLRYTVEFQEHIICVGFWCRTVCRLSRLLFYRLLRVLCPGPAADKD